MLLAKDSNGEKKEMQRSGFSPTVQVWFKFLMECIGIDRYALTGQICGFTVQEM